MLRPSLALAFKMTRFELGGRFVYSSAHTNLGRRTMPKKRKKFSAAKEARRRARIIAGAPPVARVIEDKRGKPPKHKKPAGAFEDS